MICGQLTAAIILAAGSSTRLGQSKQMVMIDGQPLIVRAVKTALAAQADIVVVILGFDSEVHRRVLEGFPVQIVDNGSWERGMGSSLKEGVSFLARSSVEVQGAVVMVCDQPLVTSEHIVNLVGTGVTLQKPIVASLYANSPGVPAYFHKNVFQFLLGIDDAHGAKNIFRIHAQNLATVPFAGGEVDIDLPTDLERFQRP